MAIATLLSVWTAAFAFAARAQIETDANLVTALDVSDSIMRHEEWLEFEGLAKAVVSTAVLEAIAGGRYGRIGFTVFAWSSGRFEVLVPWSLIGSTDGAERVASALRRFEIDRSTWARHGHDSDGRRSRPDFQTDISGAIDFAAKLELLAPYASSRTVINIAANGRDNVADGPRAARDRAVASGIVINGLVMGDKDALADYFREHVQGGGGSFVLQIREPAAVTEAMVEKLLRDLIAAR
ncbi:MAG TPA: DUF1194 domain-containing protein [Geminicoccaceae bacterium]|nr:DUF1194 domain-containing protein [Geminicoccaceae bacterium]